MMRFAAVCAVLAACSSGKATGTATLDGPITMTKSVTATSFNGADGSGSVVRGWTLDFF